ncbi:tetratricopeptide repeat protein [Botrimarina hoheduenensis]|uniref:Tetratricopeptide repeat protein n=1 Tax=Botrimarina hoheduenensis TaxID=2528000 RepID=A0A5C5VTV7_9BACT|nr:tetratricopeptide repeat protein [Botrimarina hoheduenensis]TWT41577.1 Tetratricopeptide repeat protein [Botrimarina hoheduenensis]
MALPPETAPTPSPSQPGVPKASGGPTRIGGPAISTALRQRLQQVFQRGVKCLEKGDYNYAHDLFAECVGEDPATLVYAQHLRANLAQIHERSGKKSSGRTFPRLGSGRGAVAKAADKGGWQAAFVVGCKALRKTPDDTIVLSELAEVCGGLGAIETHLYYLRWALDVAPTDAAINRQAAAVLESIAQFDQAIGCWTRVLQKQPQDAEARNAIARLSVEKTIDDGGYNPALLHGAADVTLPNPKRVASVALSDASGQRHDPQAAPAPVDPLQGATPAAREAAYRQAIDHEPAEPGHYGRLADLYVAQGRLQDAETLYRKGLEVAGGADLRLIEKLEETRLVRMRERAAIAASRAAKQAGDQAAQKLASQALAEANQAEVEVYAARADREPKNARMQYELGLRLKRVGKYREAIQPLQASRDEPAKRAEANLLLGECFQQIGQHQLALRSYEAAIAATPAGDWSDLKKLCFYRAGVLALGMGQLEVAEQRLTELASVDFAYRDVGERLDKIARVRKTT